MRHAEGEGGPEQGLAATAAPANDKRACGLPVGDAARALTAGAWLPPARPRPSSAGRSRDGRARPRPLRAPKRRRKDCEVAAAVAERWAPGGTGEERGGPWAAGLGGGAAASLAAGRRSESAAGGGGSGAGRTGTPLASAARTSARREAELAQPGP